MIRLFEGQPRSEHGGLTFGVIANQLDLSNNALLENLHGAQRANDLGATNDALATLSGVRETPDGPTEVAFPNFSVEMETGSGKTYVYIRTALELAARYGLRKYIIVVPSVAIREGVLKTFQMTKAHFAALYNNVAYQCAVYDSGNITRVRGFANSSAIEFLVMTIDSFNKASNVIRQSADRLMGDTPLQLIQATRPILILDEPQNMGSQRSRESAPCPQTPLRAPLLGHPPRSSGPPGHRLTPFDAYRHTSSRRSRSAVLTEQENYNQPFLAPPERQRHRCCHSGHRSHLTVHKLRAWAARPPSRTSSWKQGEGPLCSKGPAARSPPGGRCRR